MRRVAMLRSEVLIRSRDYWCKALENMQTNWALVDDTVKEGCLVYFFHELSGVFDRLSFASQLDAEHALRFNGFWRLAEGLQSERGGVPLPPFWEAEHPNGPIYSSGQFWRQPPVSDGA